MTINNDTMQCKQSLFLTVYIIMYQVWTRSDQILNYIPNLWKPCALKPYKNNSIKVQSSQTSLHCVCLKKATTSYKCTSI